MADNVNEKQGDPDKHTILELFSGIGGMHYAALKWSQSFAGREVAVVKSFDVSSLANKVYEFNFKETPSSKSIEHLDVAFFDSVGADTWLMSPPCQPYTSMGLQRDDEDPRARALLHLCEALPKLRNPPSFILLENVRNFETSRSHRRWKEALHSASFVTHEFLLTPPQLGIPNERLRYYCLARHTSVKGKWEGCVEARLLRYIPGDDTIMPPPPDVPALMDETEGDGVGEGESGAKGEEGAGVGTASRGDASYVDLNKKRAPWYAHCRKIGDFLDKEGGDHGKYAVGDKELSKWKGYVLDIVTDESRRCSCFTKSYSKYVRGTGSLLSTNFYDDDGRCLLDVDEPWQLHNLDLMRRLNLRYFTPAEVGRLMGFPESMAYPEGYSAVMCYKLLGNSLHVSVVAALLAHLWDPDSPNS